MADETLITLAVDIVSAHVGHNEVALEELPRLIQSVYGSLAELGKPAASEPEKHVPAVSLRASVKPDALTCLDCGKKMTMLKRHLTTHHGMTPAQYRNAWGLASDYPMVASDYAARRRDLALRLGLGRKPTASTEAPIKTNIDTQAGRKVKAKAETLAEPATTKGRKRSGTALTVLDTAPAKTSEPVPTKPKRAYRKKTVIGAAV